MSLFVGSLAFEHLPRTDYLVANRIGILVGSLVAALAGYAVLFMASKGRERNSPESRIADIELRSAISGTKE